MRIFSPKYLAAMSLPVVVVSFFAVTGSSADLDGSYVLPLVHAAIQYAAEPVDDRIAALQQRMREGKVKWNFDSHGYLRTLLDELQVPISSQVLVFSKTSFQPP